jgi:predicted nucleic acid-binding protein
MILRRIPRLNWTKFADLFQPEGEFTVPVDPDAFVLITDLDDRKFAALSEAASCPLVTNDHHLLSQRNTVGIKVLTPAEFLAPTEKEGD